MTLSPVTLATTVFSALFGYILIICEKRQDGTQIRPILLETAPVTGLVLFTDCFYG